MHELSIVQDVVAAATEALQGTAFRRVLEVRMHVGVLSGVVEEALQFGYSIATQDTILEGSRLVVVMLPVRIHCRVCQSDSELPGVQSFRCPACGTPASDIRQGRELEIESLQIEEGAPD